MIALFVPGTGVLHRIGAGTKLGALALLALVVSLLPAEPPVMLGALLMVVLLHPIARLPWRVLVAPVRQLWPVLLVLAAFLVVFSSPAAAASAIARVLALVLLAGIVTATTPMAAIVGAFARIIGPLRRFGADPEAIAFALSLTLTLIPVVAGFLADIREAARARGVRVGPRAILILLVRALRHADQVGEALSARGLA